MLAFAAAPHRPRGEQVADPAETSRLTSRSPARRAAQTSRAADRDRPGVAAFTATSRPVSISASTSAVLPGQAQTSGLAARRSPGRSSPTSPTSHGPPLELARSSTALRAASRVA